MDSSRLIEQLIGPPSHIMELFWWLQGHFQHRQGPPTSHFEWPFNADLGDTSIKQRHVAYQTVKLKSVDPAAICQAMVNAFQGIHHGLTIVWRKPFVLEHDVCTGEYLLYGRLGFEDGRPVPLSTSPEEEAIRISATPRELMGDSNPLLDGWNSRIMPKPRLDNEVVSSSELSRKVLDQVIADPPMVENFCNYPPTLGEQRAEKSQSSDDWSPREALISTLRGIDSGKIKPTQLLVLMRLENNQFGYRAATSSLMDTLALAARIIHEKDL